MRKGAHRQYRPQAHVHFQRQNGSHLGPQEDKNIYVILSFDEFVRLTTAEVTWLFKAIARSDIFFCLKTNWRRVGIKRQKKISFRGENSA